MKTHFALSPQHTLFFAKNGFISFENFLSAKDGEMLKKETTRLQPTYTFDLFRHSPLLAKWIKQPSLVRLLEDLFQASTFRIGFDLYLPNLENLPTSLEKWSFAKPLVGALFIPLSHSLEILCASCTRELPWPQILNGADPYYLIVYAAKNARYSLEPQNPHTHDWKKLGLAFGDRLSEKTHFLCK